MYAEWPVASALVVAGWDRGEGTQFDVADDDALVGVAVGAPAGSPKGALCDCRRARHPLLARWPVVVG